MRPAVSRPAAPVGADGSTSRVDRSSLLRTDRMLGSDLSLVAMRWRRRSRPTRTAAAAAAADPLPPMAVGQ